MVRPRPDVLVASYVHDFEQRLARKPGRMITNARRNPVSFIFHYLPRGLVNKPREVFEEWETLAHLSMAARRGAANDERAAKPRTVAR
jgi:hypothetical protein